MASSTAAGKRAKRKPQAALKVFGAEWHRGEGAKARMKALAAEMECRAGVRCECQVQLQDPDSGARHFACYRTWEEAMRQLRRLRGQHRHLFEIVAHGRPCKPYLDVDGPPLPTAGFATVAEVVEHFDALVIGIFLNDYEVTLAREQLIWLVSPQSDKLSLHLTVCTAGGIRPNDPQWVYSSNHQSDPTGASHLAQRIRQLDPERAGPLVDVSVYSKDREMRAVGACKFGKSGESALVPVRELLPGQPASDALITCLNDAGNVRLLVVPGHIPRAVRTRGRELRTPAEAAELEPDEERSMIVVRMLDLLREELHPTAYHDRRSAEAPRDPAVGIKFNYRDRSEACYTGHVHEGAQNLR
jgi:hypothetical protein